MTIQKIMSGAAKVAGWAPDAMMVGGAATISYGAGLVYEPAGYVMAGILAMAGGYLLARGAK